MNPLSCILKSFESVVVTSLAKVLIKISLLVPVLCPLWVDLSFIELVALRMLARGVNHKWEACARKGSIGPPTYQIIKVTNVNHMSMMKTNLATTPEMTRCWESNLDLTWHESPRQRCQKWLVVGQSNLDLSSHKPPRQRRQKSFLLPLEHCVGFPLKRKG